MNNSVELKKNIKDSLFTGLIALAIFGPIVGLRTRLQKEGLYIDPQWLMVIFLVVGSAVGRFLINLNSSSYNEGEILKLEAIPSENYSFDFWSGDFNSNQSLTNLNVDSDKTVIASSIKCRSSSIRI